MTEEKKITVYVDADACPVKAEIYRVAERYGVKVYVVSNSFMAIPARSDDRACHCQRWLRCRR